MIDRTPQQSSPLLDAPVRIAIVSTPRSGNNWLRHLLMTLYGAPSAAVHHPDEIDWGALPPSFVLQIHWPPAPAFLDILQRYQFRTVTLARHPLDVLISILHFTLLDESTGSWLRGAPCNEDGIFAAMPCSAAFLAYATGARADALLSVSRAWWLQPECLRLRYEALAQDPVSALQELGQGLGMATKSSVEEAVASNTFQELQHRDEFHFWRGQPGLWKTLLPKNEACLIARAQAPSFSLLGYECDPDPTLTTQQADANWIQLAREDLPNGLRKLRALQQAFNGAQAELANERAVQALQRQRLLETTAALAATREQLSRFEDLSPLGLNLARTLHRLSLRLPRLSAAFKRLIHCDSSNHLDKRVQK